MYTITNNQLTVTILDPVSDRARLGSRYCTGGYIYQVTDLDKGELFSGPEYPDPYPDVFDGQGAPDMFQTALLPGNVPVGGEVGCIGVGRVKRTSPREPFDVRFNPSVIEFLAWDTQLEKSKLVMQAEQVFEPWRLQLTRQVALEGRTVVSSTSVTCTGSEKLPIRWFAHPFFPLTREHVLCQFTPGVSMPDNPAYRFNEAGFICRKPEFDWSRGGYYQPLQLQGNSPLKVVEKHDRAGEVITTTDFVPGFLPIWGNQNTFSFEPYYIRELAPREKATWTISYTF
jgi:hypothetical protein